MCGLLSTRCINEECAGLYRSLVLCLVYFVSAGTCVRQLLLCLHFSLLLFPPFLSLNQNPSPLFVMAELVHFKYFKIINWSTLDSVHAGVEASFFFHQTNLQINCSYTNEQGLIILAHGIRWIRTMLEDRGWQSNWPLPEWYKCIIHHFGYCH